MKRYVLVLVTLLAYWAGASRGDDAQAQLEALSLRKDKVDYDAFVRELAGRRGEPGPTLLEVGRALAERYDNLTAAYEFCEAGAAFDPALAQDPVIAAVRNAGVVGLYAIRPTRSVADESGGRTPGVLAVDYHLPPRELALSPRGDAEAAVEAVVEYTLLSAPQEAGTAERTVLRQDTFSHSWGPSDDPQFLSIGSFYWEEGQLLKLKVNLHMVGSIEEGPSLARELVFTFREIQERDRTVVRGELEPALSSELTEIVDALTEFAWRADVEQEASEESVKALPLDLQFADWDTDYPHQVSDSTALNRRITVVDYFATWCDPCWRAMPAISALHQEHRPDLWVVSACVDDEHARGNLDRLLEEHKIQHPVALVTEACFDAAGIDVVPTVVVYDSGKEVWRGHRLPPVELLDRLLAPR